MASIGKLKEEDQRFFQLVSAAAFSNPFGDKRLELDKQLGGLPGGTKDELLQAALDSVRDRVLALERTGRASLALYGKEDRACLALGLLFWRRDRIAGALLLPYLLWVTYAVTLSIGFAVLNLP